MPAAADVLTPNAAFHRHDAGLVHCGGARACHLPYPIRNASPTHPHATRLRSDPSELRIPTWFARTAPLSSSRPDLFTVKHGVATEVR